MGPKQPESVVARALESPAGEFSIVPSGEPFRRTDDFERRGMSLVQDLQPGSGNGDLSRRFIAFGRLGHPALGSPASDHDVILAGPVLTWEQLAGRASCATADAASSYDVVGACAC